MKTHLLSWILLLPLASAVLLSLLHILHIRVGKRTAGIISSVVATIVFALSVQAFLLLEGISSPSPHLKTEMYTWLNIGSLQIDFTLLLDPLSALLLLLTSGVSALVHVYSISYLRYSPRTQSYFSYLSLLLFSMLLLILADNPISMLVGWQAASLSSFLLVRYGVLGAASPVFEIKAFLVNRLGDIAFLLGAILLLWSIYPYLQAGDSFSFAAIQKYSYTLQGVLFFRLSAVEVATFCFLISVLIKSAQFPFHIWLPDTTGAPSPASALIHTMCTAFAGVYLVVRLHFLFEAAPVVSSMVAYVGGVSALFAASLGLFQNDIKKILTYTTISQLGLMMVALGLGAYATSSFHLVTHTFSMTLLFLCVGSVFTSTMHEQDLRKMGGLLRHLKITGTAFLIGSLSLVGFPGVSGFFSLNEILWKAFQLQHPLLWAMGTLTVLLTAFALTRLFCLIFLGELRNNSNELAQELEEHPQETSTRMLIPTMILSVFAFASGVVGFPYFLTQKQSVLEQWLRPIFVTVSSYSNPSSQWMATPVPPTRWLSESGVMFVTTLFMLLGVGLAVWLYAGTSRGLKSIEREAQLQQPNEGGLWGSLFRAIYHKFYIDEFYKAAILQPIQKLSRDGLSPFDQFVIGGIVKIVGQVIQIAGKAQSWFQSWHKAFCAFLIATGSLWFLFWFLLTATK